MKLSPVAGRFALLVSAIALGIGMPLYARGAASTPAETAAVLNLVGPVANAQLNPGGPVPISWTGGSATADVKLRLRDVDAATLITLVTSSTPNSTPSYTWTLPASLPCNRRYAFAIAQVPNNTSWIDGPIFRLKCEVQLFNTHVGANYIIRLRNGAYPIKPLINPTAGQTRSVPSFRVMDSPTTYVTIIAGGSGIGPGTWSPASAPGAVGPAPLVPLVFALNLNAQTIAPNAWIAQYTLPGTSQEMMTMVVRNCVSEMMSVSDALGTGGTITALADVLPANNTSICVL
jgi:hypothetical protein